MLPHFYYNADVMVHIPLIDWCPNSVIEALACQVPVITSHNGGTKELVYMCGNLGEVIELEGTYEYGEEVPLYDPPKVDVSGLAKAMNYWIGNHEHVSFLRKEQYQFPFTIENVAEKYAGLF